VPALLFVVLQRLHLCARIRVGKTYSLSSSCIIPLWARRPYYGRNWPWVHPARGA